MTTFPILIYEKKVILSLIGGEEGIMKTITKKDLVEQVAQKSGIKRMVVKKIVQDFLDSIVDELSQSNRLEFRDFGVFEVRSRAARTAQNPKTLERVEVPQKQTVRFKPGRMMKLCLETKEETSSEVFVETKEISRISQIQEAVVTH